MALHICGVSEGLAPGSRFYLKRKAAELASVWRQKPEEFSKTNNLIVFHQNRPQRSFIKLVSILLLYDHAAKLETFK